MITELAIAYSDTSAGELVWHLGGARRDTLASVFLRLDAITTMELVVIGSSHQVVFRRGDAELVETIACPMPGDVAAIALPPLVERDEAVGHYMLTSTVEHVRHERFADAVDALVENLLDRDDAVVARFPGSVLAVTALAADVLPSSIGWRTWHAYPQTRELVATHSIVVAP